MTIYTIQERQPLGRWEFVETAEMTFEEAATRCWNLLVENGGDAHEARFAKMWKTNWTYLPQFPENRPTTGVTYA